MRSKDAAVDRPPSDFRLKDLCQWHIVEAICWRCKRSGPIDHRTLLRGRRPETRLVDLERHLRCTECDRLGVAADHTIVVRMAARN
jgi:hypothetical protein